MRNEYDFYPTPNWCYESLPIDFSQFKTAHEPCAGDGRIVKFLESKGLITTYSEIQEGHNFFDWDDTVDLIFTNPPYSMAQEFVEHSLARANCVIMLLRINFLGAQKRYDWWVKNEPDALIVLSNRPSFTGKGTDSTEYAWYVWQDKEYIPNGITHIKR
jgi:DNA modification methylase